MNKTLNIKKNLLYNSIGNFIYLLCQWIITIIIVRLSGYEDAGVLALCMSISNVFYTFSSFSMRGYQSSDLKEEFTHSVYFKSRLLTCFVANILCILFMVVSDYSLNTKLCIIIYNIFKTSEAFVDVIHGEEQKKWRLDISGISFSIRGIISLITFITMLYFTKSLLFTITLMTLFIYVFIYFYDIKMYKKIIGVISKIQYKKIFILLYKCLPITLYGILTTLIPAYPKIVLEKQMGEELLGIYSSIYSPTTIIQVAAMFIFNPLITLFAEYYIKKEKKNFYKLILKNIVIIIIIAILGIIGVNIFGEIGLKILYGEEIIKYSYLLDGLVIVTVMTALSWFISNILIASRKFCVLIFGPIISSITTLIISANFIAKYGLNGVNYIIIIALGIQIVFGIIFGNILINRDFKKIIQESQKMGR